LIQIDWIDTGNQINFFAPFFKKKNFFFTFDKNFNQGIYGSIFFSKYKDQSKDLVRTQCYVLSPFFLFEINFEILKFFLYLIGQDVLTVDCSNNRQMCFEASWNVKKKENNKKTKKIKI
jgi:hypothetical protein